jgi:hypothetical protein
MFSSVLVEKFETSFMFIIFQLKVIFSLNKYFEELEFKKLSFVFSMIFVEFTKNKKFLYHFSYRDKIKLAITKVFQLQVAILKSN